MGAKTTKTLLDIAKMNEDEARTYLEDVRWNGKPVCPHCDSEQCGTLKGIKDKKGNIRKGLYKCYNKDCRKQFTVTVGTVMHRSHLSMQQWIVAFYLMASGKKGVSALELQRVLGIGSYQSAWHLAHRIREAMKHEPLVSKLTGIIEADGTYVGGKSRKGIRGPDSESKTPVMAVIERDGSAVVKPIERVDGKTLKGAIKEVTDPKAMICTDEFVSYRGVGKDFAGGHHTVNHASGEYASGNVHVNSCEPFFGLLKRGEHGTFHSVSKKHLERYCDEFAFRWNHRQVSDTTRTEAMISSIANKRLEYSSLIGR